MEFYYHGVDRDILILAADGGLNADTATGFTRDLGTILDAGIRRVIVDCTNLRYVSSYGMGVLVRLHKRMWEHGGQVKIAAVQAPVARLIALVRLDEVFQVYPTVDDARASFRAGGEPAAR